MEKTGRCIVTLDGAPWSNDRHEPVILRKRSEEEKDRDRQVEGDMNSSSLGK
jgi:hypothetical protein